MPLDALERRLCDDLDARGDAMLDDLACHVAIPTRTGHETGLAEYRGLIEARLRAVGARIERRPGRARPAWVSMEEGDADETPPPVVVARGPNDDTKGPRVLLVGHLDTVHPPDSPFRELTPDPGGAIVRGPGAVDMKGGVLVALNALEALHRAGVPLRWTYALNSDEETGSMQSLHVLEDLAREHDYGVVTEPALADGSLAVERMGSGTFRIDVSGRAAHVGRAFADGVSAVNRLAEVILEAARLADPERGRIVSIGPIRGGTATNVVPDRAAAWGNARFADTAAGEDLGAALDALATPADAMPRVVVHRIWNRPAKPLTPAVEAFAATARAAAEDLGQELPFDRTGGVCDGNILQGAGLPTLDTLGVRGGNLHRTDEFVEVASLVERARLMAVLLARLATGLGRGA